MLPLTLIVDVLCTFMRRVRTEEELISDDSGSLFAVAKDAELDENSDILDHSTQRANQPWKIGEEVFFFDRVE